MADGGTSQEPVHQLCVYKHVAAGDSVLYRFGKVTGLGIGRLVQVLKQDGTLNLIPANDVHEVAMIPEGLEVNVELDKPLLEIKLKSGFGITTEKITSSTATVDVRGFGGFPDTCPTRCKLSEVFLNPKTVELLFPAQDGK